jgi:hypothetical protein
MVSGTFRFTAHHIFMSNEFIKTVRLKSSEQFQFDGKVRVIVLIVENFSPEEDFCSWLEGVETPIILALRISTNEKLVSATHLCLVAQNAAIGKLSAEEALKLGLINKIVSLDEVEAEAFSVAEKISLLAPLAIRACLKAVNQGLEMSLEEGLKLETELFSKIFSTADMREGTQAFLEKRKPVFRGE